MIHKSESPLADKKVKIKPESNLSGGEILIEDWWDRVSGRSWKNSNGNPAAMGYAVRSAGSHFINIPSDDEVLYGKIGIMGYIVHVSELDI
ncbi:hypothetical protein [Emticicia fontis]